MPFTILRAFRARDQTNHIDPRGKTCRRIAHGPRARARACVQGFVVRLWDEKR